MTAFYDRLEATARRLIRDKGQAAFVLRQGAPTGPPHNPTPGADQRIECLVVEVGYSLTDRNATLVQHGDKLGIMSTEIEIAPLQSDRLEIGGIEYSIVDLKPLSPGGTVLLWEYHARR